LLVPHGQVQLPKQPYETVRDIRSNRSWMVLWNLEQDEKCRRVIDVAADAGRWVCGTIARPSARGAAQHQFRVGTFMDEGQRLVIFGVAPALGLVH